MFQPVAAISTQSLWIADFPHHVLPILSPGNHPDKLGSRQRSTWENFGFSVSTHTHTLLVNLRQSTTLRVVVHDVFSFVTRDLSTCWVTISCLVLLPSDLRNETLMSVAASKFKSYEKLADAGGFFEVLCFSLCGCSWIPRVDGKR